MSLKASIQPVRAFSILKNVFNVLYRKRTGTPAAPGQVKVFGNRCMDTAQFWNNDLRRITAPVIKHLHLNLVKIDYLANPSLTI